MIVRFCLYSVFKNLRFADPVLVLFFLAIGMNYTEAGLLLGYQHLLTVSLEVPSGYLADRCGRRRILVACFAAYCCCYVTLGSSQWFSQESQMEWLYFALTCFGLGEALRTGSHKAIMLDYLDLQGESGRVTELIGLTRSFSKYSSGASAICGGLLLAVFQRFDLLFWFSAAPAAAGIVLMLTYPRYLDGECTRSAHSSTPSESPSWRDGFRGMFARPGTMTLMLQSVLYESQIKVILKYYAQPMMQIGLEKQGIYLAEAKVSSLLGRSGAFWIGAMEFIRDSIGGIASRLSRSFESRFFTKRGALYFCYTVATLLSLLIVVAVTALGMWLVAPFIFFVLLTAIQNVRRPIFVSALNERMEKSMRATMLSMESVGRAIVVAMVLPMMGLLADRYGVQYALGVPMTLLFLGTFLGLPERQRQNSSVAQA
jgi:MFS family permease